MKAIVLTAIVLTGCGSYDAAVGQLNAATDTGSSTSTSTATATDAATQTAPGVSVTVRNETIVTVGGTAPASADTSLTARGPSTVLTFVDGSFGAFFPDGTFDHGLATEMGETVAASCSYQAPDCSGTCYIAHPPAHMSIFGNGAAMWVSGGQETDRGRMVVTSTWSAGRCVAATESIAHSYEMTLGWTVPAGNGGDQ